MNKYFKYLYIVAALLLPAIVQAQNVQQAPKQNSMSAAAIVMLSVMGVLIAVIIVLANLVFSSYTLYKEKLKKATSLIPFLLMAFVLTSQPAAAQETSSETAVVSHSLVSGLSNTSLFLMFGIIILELIIIVFLLRTFRLFAGLKKERKAAPAVSKESKKRYAWLEKINNTKSVDEEAEASINLGHDYDGIGELDNPTPPWWQWGFVISVIFAGVYLYTHHVSHSAPTQIQELTIANIKAEEQQKRYLANSANKIDENTVTYLNDPADLAEGKTIFTAVCAACHGADGGGIVGPNLTDEYWLHGGGMKNIFKTIKYGVPEKGMKSCKEDYSPKKIAQIASYIHSLQGSKPAAPKEPQGEIYKDEVNE